MMAVWSPRFVWARGRDAFPAKRQTGGVRLLVPPSFGETVSVFWIRNFRKRPKVNWKRSKKKRMERRKGLRFWLIWKQAPWIWVSSQTLSGETRIEKISSYFIHIKYFINIKYSLTGFNDLFTFVLKWMMSVYSLPVRVLMLNLKLISFFNVFYYFIIFHFF